MTAIIAKLKSWWGAVVAGVVFLVALFGAGYLIRARQDHKQDEEDEKAEEERREDLDEKLEDRLAEYYLQVRHIQDTMPPSADRLRAILELQRKYGLTDPGTTAAEGGAAEGGHDNN